MTLRKIVLGGLAALIVVATLIVAGINVTTKPTFILDAPGLNHDVKFIAECHAIGPGLLNYPGRSDGSVDLEIYNQVYEGMGAEDFEAYMTLYTESKTLPLETDEFLAYRVKIQDQISYHCGQLRENQQTGLMMTFGVSLLMLMSVGVTAILSAPRRELNEKD